MKALIIDEPWIGLILRGEKTWEMRRTACHQKGQIALIRKGSGQVVGFADCEGSLPALADAYRAAEPRHRIPVDRQTQAFADGWRTPWVITNARPLDRPVAYAHRSGAVIWVNLDPMVAEVVAAQAGALPVSVWEVQAHPCSSASDELRTPAASSIPGKRTPIRGWIDGNVAHLPLSEANIANGHFYLRSILEFFPPEAVGGSDKTQTADQLLTVRYQPGLTVNTDIAGPNRDSLQKRSSHLFFRDRASIRDFFARSGARGGDTLIIQRDSPNIYTVTLEKLPAA
ncbi:hypothetical protein ASF59_14570 [Methylobacterium sp. Leaf121]|nr:hypothetical protein ASF59_14570 [Methylobacterium sp. Leaf121]